MFLKGGAEPPFKILKGRASDFSSGSDGMRLRA